MAWVCGEKMYYLFYPKQILLSEVLALLDAFNTHSLLDRCHIFLHILTSQFLSWFQHILWMIHGRFSSIYFQAVFGKFGFIIFGYVAVNFSMLWLLDLLFSFFAYWSNHNFSEGNYLTNYLASKGPDLEPFVLGSLIQLYCRITKFGWLDDDRFRDVVKEAMNFLNQVTWPVFIL